jgi:phosphate transport system permease protein
MVIAVPLGIGTAAFLSEIATGWIRKTGSFLVEMLAAIPSVVYGFWAFFVLVPMVQWFFTAVGGPNQGGTGILSAGLILSVMIVPYVAAVSFDVCQAVPNSQREASYALGATRWQTIWSVVLPYARPGIMGGCFLALGRALGETMAVTMLIGNNNRIDLSLFATGSTIPSVLANEFAGANMDLHRSALVELALVLLLVSIACNSVARLLIWRVASIAKGSTFLGNAAFWRAKVPLQTIANGTDITVMPPHLNGSHTRPVQLPPQTPAVAPASARNTLINFVMTGVLGSCLVVTGGVLLFILCFLVYHGVDALNWDFFVNNPRPVGETGGGMANALYGSFLLVGLASAFAVPIGILAAVFLAEYRSDYLGPIVRFIGELLAGVPSIVIGIFAYYLLVRPMGHYSGWAGAFALGVMMIPIVMRTSEEALRLVPQSLRHARYALGANQWQTVLKVTLPAAFPAVITAIFLAVARVVGETAPLLFTAGDNRGWPDSPNTQIPSLPYFIFVYSTSASEDWRRQGWAAALVLLVVVMLLSFGVRLVTGRRAISTRQAG